MPAKYRGRNSETGLMRGKYRKYVYEADFGPPAPGPVRGYFYGKIGQEYERVFTYLDRRGILVASRQGVRESDDADYAIAIFHYAGATVGLAALASHLFQECSLSITLVSNDNIDDVIRKFSEEVGISRFIQHR